MLVKKVEENIDDISRQISMAFIKDTVYKQLSNLKPENVLLPGNGVHIFLHTIPNPPGSAKQDSCIRKNGKAEDKEDGSEFLLLPCVPVFMFWGIWI